MNFHISTLVNLSKLQIMADVPLASNINQKYVIYSDAEDTDTSLQHSWI